MTVDEWEGLFRTNRTLIERRVAGSMSNSGRSVRLIAVSKGLPIEAIEGAYQAGQRWFGENYADELVRKAEQLAVVCPEIKWTFQGRLQSNKINRLLPHVALWQSVDSSDRAEALGRRVPGGRALVQIDVTRGNLDRSGVLMEDVPVVLESARSAGLEVVGLMTVAPLAVHNAGSVSEVFRVIRALADSLDLAECSMGMSDDLEEAVAEGSTMIRVGSALFGHRQGVSFGGR